MTAYLALALVALALVVVGIAALHWIGGTGRQAGPRNLFDEFEDSLDTLLAGLAIMSVVMLILGIYGVFSIGLLAGLVALLGLAYMSARGPAGGGATTDEGPGRGALKGFLIVVATILALYAVAPPYESRLNSSDASIYLGAGADLARSGRFINDDALVAQMTPAERRDLFSGKLFTTGRMGTYYHRLPGGVQLMDPDQSAVTFNFYHLWPAWLALEAGMGGGVGPPAVLSLFVAVSAICLFMLGRLLAGGTFGIVAVIFLFATFPQIHYSRVPLSELPAQAFFLAGLWCFLRALQSSGDARRRQQILAGLLWGCLCLVRADGALYLFPALAFAFLAIGELRRSALQWLPMTMPIVAMAGLALLHQTAGNAYELPLSGEAIQTVARWIRAHERAFVAAWILLWIAAGVLLSRPELARLRKPIAVAMATIFISSALGWLISFPQRFETETFVEHVQWLLLYLPGAVAPLVAIGVLMLAASRRSPVRDFALLLLIFLAVPLASVLISPLVTPVQPWAVRRFVPMALPLLLTASLLGWRHGLSALGERFHPHISRGYFLVPLLGLAWLVPQWTFLWRQPLYKDIGDQVKQLAGRIPEDALVVLPYSLAATHLAVVLNYGERRSSMLLPLEGESGADPASTVESFLARQVGAGRKVIALLRTAPDASSALSGFQLTPGFAGVLTFAQVPEVGPLDLPRSARVERIAYQAFEVRARSPGMASAAVTAEALARTLAGGLDLTKPVLPAGVVSTKGISTHEPTGRWTNGPVVRVVLAHPLPPRFSLEIALGGAYAREPSKPVEVMIGGHTKVLALPPGGAGTVRLQFAPPETADAIEIRIPDPVSPKSRGDSADSRRLGLLLKSIRVIPETGVPHSPGTKLAAAPPPPPLTDGVDLSLPELSKAISRTEGLSHAEPLGRWTDGPLARLQLARPLPTRFSLELVVAGAYARNNSAPLHVAIGGQDRELRLPQGGAGTVLLDFETIGAADMIEIRIPGPVSPQSRGESTDTRQLGVRLKSLKVVTATVAKTAPSGAPPPAPGATASIDFSKAALPGTVMSVTGFSGVEPTGRWTVGPTARVRMRTPLPPKFTLELDVTNVYAPNLGQPFVVRIGGQTRRFTMKTPSGVLRLPFAPRGRADSVELRIPKPASPASRRESKDTRLLGIHLHRLRIVPAP